jgi:hypothetical protein
MPACDAGLDLGAGSRPPNAPDRFEHLGVVVSSSIDASPPPLAGHAG